MEVQFDKRRNWMFSLFVTENVIKDRLSLFQLEFEMISFDIVDGGKICFVLFQGFY
jgi:hypothetical protein